MEQEYREYRAMKQTKKCWKQCKHVSTLEILRIFRWDKNSDKEVKGKTEIEGNLFQNE